jgi:uncharacterized protein YjiS (DUF1127 family)
MDPLTFGSAPMRSLACGRGFRRLLQLFARWRRRSIGRRQLQRLDPRALGDLGLNLADQYREGSKSFWQE